MKNKFYLYLLPCIVLIQCCTKGEPEIDKYSEVPIRQPAVAGRFYSADSSRLKKALDIFFEEAVIPAAEKPVAIVVPHAGYIYSGQIAADAYNQVRNHPYDLIVILGTNHTTAGFNAISIYPQGGYQTPLGLVKIDEKIARSLINSKKKYIFNPDVHKNEHSIEVQIPFIQYLFPGIKILPVIIGAPDPDLCIEFGQTLASVLKKRKALIVASSDLSHYPGYEHAREVDKRTLETMTELDAAKLHSVLKNQLYRNIPNLSTGACGEAPVLAAMEAAKKLGARSGSIVSYANSGDLPVGNRDRVVGYGAVVFTREKKNKKDDLFFTPSSDKQSVNLQDSQKKALLEFARKSINQFLTTETVPLARGFESTLHFKTRVFVTLKINQELRGCIGHMNNDLPLCKVVGTMALQAAFNDRRFRPVSVDEMENIEIEISILTPFQPIDNIKEIVLGRDGVVLRKDINQAVFLPQVATEQGWSRTELLDNLCRKTGLEESCWKQDTQLFIFQAEVFQESEIL